MEREERKQGRSRLWRGVAVVGMSVGLMFVTTTPSQAVDVPIPTIPLQYAPETILGTGVAVAGLTAAGLLTAPYVATAAALLSVAGGAVIWSHTPTAPAVDDVAATWTVSPYSANGQVNYTVRHPNTSPTGGTTHFFRAALVKASGVLEYSSFCTNSSGGSVVSIGAGKSKPVGSTDTCYYNQNTSDPYIGVLVQYRIGGTTGSYYVVASSTVSNTAAAPGTVEQTYPVQINLGTDPYAPQREKSETTCSGVATPIITYGPQFSLNSPVRPDLSIGQGCPNGSRPVKTVVTQEELTPAGWFPSPWAPKDVQCGSALPSTSIQCVAGFIASVSHVPAATDPTSPVKDCVTGSKTCSVTISKGTADCKTAGACSDYQQKKDQVAAGSTTWDQAGYQCSYDGVPVSMSQCEWVDSVAVNTTTTGTVTNDFACGWDLGCYVSELFVPNQTNTQQRITQLKTAFEATPFGLVPQFFTGITAPFYQNPFSPSNENCAGPTLTLPKNMGVEGIDVVGDYVIQPLYACPDTEAGEFGATISGGLRDILTPTVYVTGAYVVVNTLLSAMGLALPMLTRGADIDYNTGEIGPTRWRLRR